MTTPDIKKYYTTPFLLAVLLHVIVIIVVLFSLDLSTKVSFSPQPTPAQDNAVIQAVSVNQAQIDQEVSRLQTQQQQQAQQRREQQQKLIQQKQELQKQQERAARALAALQAEQQNLAKQKAQQQAQQEQLQKQQAAMQAKQRQQAAQQELQQKLAAEQQTLAANKAKQVNAIVTQYNSLILNAIYPHWIVTDKQKGLSTDLLINLANNGTVLNVTVQKSSGSSAFDASAVAAVYKSSPLPVPKDPAAFAVFREFRLTLKPENIKAVG